MLLSIVRDGRNIRAILEYFKGLRRPMKITEEELLTTQEIADILKIAKTTVVKKLSSGEIPGAIKIGRKLRLPRSKLEKYLKEKTIK